MTRFARAKGSKASNERLPDEPTPWHVMKQQLEDSVASKQTSQSQKTKSAKELLKERDEPFYCDLGAVNHDWAEFQPEKVKPSINKQSKDSTGAPAGGKNKKKSLGSNLGDNKLPEAAVNPENSPSSSKKSKKRKSMIESTPQGPAEACDAPGKNQKINKEENKLPEGAVNPENSPSPSKKSKKRKSIHPSASENNSPEAKKPKMNEEKSPAPSEKFKNQKKVKSPAPSTPKEDEAPGNPSVKLSKRQKRNRKNRITSSGDQSKIPEGKDDDRRASGAFNTAGNEWSTEIKFGSKRKDISSPEDSKPPDSDRQQNKFQSRNESQTPGTRNGSTRLQSKFDNQRVVKRGKTAKIRDDKEHKRRKPTPGTTKVIINGMEIEIVMYDGFPVKKEDAERLQELRKQMVMRGIPKSEINAAMKLERRKAEKALSRVRKNVCFHCRKAGHNLSDCPELGKEEAATGICFKCGSTEHTHFECRVTRKEEFGFAKCFICREQGHIAKQCPDNPKGLYPRGGACKICGDVTHLRKDCPDLAQGREENAVTVGRILDEAVEDLGGERRGEESREQKQKVVTF
ncbi:neurofilament heavy polypeptide [Diachasma alloeum]|uniref:neurofilament heavy polypeptide n=1 Tax=Diachasma alloeum TaxID=454923 RepID=UPI0007381EB0|nr:neurofilament heavy polypeptide [Diachasma alloeum]XP_015126793.1 neurofilament heavy polypeptide [Diachasma alloeum]